jgi:hypothetical protein
MNYTKQDKSIIYGIVNDRNYLTPIFNSVYNIPQMVKDYDNSLFIVFNNKRNRYELHSIDSYMPSIKGWSTYLMVLGTKLDNRVIEKIYMNDFQKHGKHILQEIDDHNDMIKESSEYMMSLRMKKASDNVVSYLNGTLDAY